LLRWQGKAANVLRQGRRRTGEAEDNRFAFGLEDGQRAAELAKGMVGKRLT